MQIVSASIILEELPFLHLAPQEERNTIFPYAKVKVQSLAGACCVNSNWPLQKLLPPLRPTFKILSFSFPIHSANRPWNSCKTFWRSQAIGSGGAGKRDENALLLRSEMEGRDSTMK